MINLRPYQLEAVRASVEALRRHRSALLVLPTGTGKTTIFVELARLARRGRVLLLSHRDELVNQAAERVHTQLGVEAGIEKAEQRPGDESIVCGSVQTMRGQRLEAWPRDAFSIIIVDEAHHAAAATYRAILEHFDIAKVLGVTATPDRSDGKGLRCIFDTVAYEYSIAEAIAAGWLVEPSLWRVKIDSIDLRGVKKSRGDLVQGALEEAVAKGVHSAATVLLERAGDRLTLVYTPGVATAHDLARVLCAARPGCAAAIDGTTPTDERRQILASHARGEYQFLVNCQVLTEGYDSPSVSCLGLLRPTLSRGLYAQMLGRGLRPASGKGDCLVLDFTDSSGRHDLVGPEDVLGSSEDVAAEAKRKAAETDPEEPVRVTDALASAEAEVRYRLERVEAEKRRKEKKLISPDDVAGLLGWKLPRTGKPATERQLQALERFGIDAGGLSGAAASEMLDSLVTRARKSLATPKQLRILARQGRAHRAITREHASGLIDAMFQRRGRLRQQKMRGAKA
jgi:superfamily II DNA or RNA helicase